MTIEQCQVLPAHAIQGYGVWKYSCIYYQRQQQVEMCGESHVPAFSFQDRGSVTSSPLPIGRRLNEFHVESR